MRVYESDLPNDNSTRLLWTVFDEHTEYTVALFTEEKEALRYSSDNEKNQGGLCRVRLEKVSVNEFRFTSFDEITEEQ